MTYALITGASKGIGRALAREWAGRGHNVLLIARSESLLQHEAEAIRKEFGVSADFFAADLSDPRAPERVFYWCHEKGYRVDVLMNNAGFGSSGAFDKISLEEQLQMMQVNMNTLVALTHLFLPFLRQLPRAYILNIASSAAYQAVPFLSVYAASKAFVLTFTRGLHVELNGSSVSVTCVCPGSTDTDFAHTAQVGAKAMKAAAKVNMKPEDVARQAIDSMLSGKAEKITGLINQVGAFLVWLLPKRLAEKTAAGLYK